MGQNNYIARKNDSANLDVAVLQRGMYAINVETGIGVTAQKLLQQ